jgi:hypothetical protein
LSKLLEGPTGTPAFPFTTSLDGRAAGVGSVDNNDGISIDIFSVNNNDNDASHFLTFFSGATFTREASQSHLLTTTRELY